MYRIIILFAFSIIFSENLCADGSLLEITSIEYKGELYFIEYEENYRLSMGDSCYYDDYYKCYMDISDWVSKVLVSNGNDSIVLYKELHRLYMGEFRRGRNTKDFLILRNKVVISKDEIGEIFVREVVGRQYYGYIYSNQLSEKDNYILTNTSYTILGFEEVDEGYCALRFFGKPKLEYNHEFNEIRNLLLVKGYFNKHSKEIYERLRNMEIITIGFCSC